MSACSPFLCFLAVVRWCTSLSHCGLFCSGDFEFDVICFTDLALMAVHLADITILFVCFTILRCLLYMLETSLCLVLHLDLWFTFGVSLSSLYIYNAVFQVGFELTWFWPSDSLCCISWVLGFQVCGSTLRTWSVVVDVYVKFRERVSCLLSAWIVHTSLQDENFPPGWKVLNLCWKSADWMY